MRAQVRSKRIESRAFKQRCWKDGGQIWMFKLVNLKDLWAGMGEVEYKGRSLEMTFGQYMAEEPMAIPGDVSVARRRERMEWRGRLGQCSQCKAFR